MAWPNNKMEKDQEQKATYRGTQSHTLVSHEIIPTLTSSTL